MFVLYDALENRKSTIYNAFQIWNVKTSVLMYLLNGEKKMDMFIYIIKKTDYVDDYVDIFKMLLYTGIDFNETKKGCYLSPFWYSVIHNNDVCFDLMCQDNKLKLDLSRTDDRNRNILHNIAISKNHRQMKKMIDYMDENLDFYQKLFMFNEQDCQGETPLLCAVNNGCEKCVELLANNNLVDVNKQNNWDVAPLYIAIYKHYIGCVKILCKRDDLIINQISKTGTPGLILAIERKSFECVKLLCEHKNIDVNFTGNFNKTPLHMAISTRQENIIQFLCNLKDIRFDIKDFNRNTQRDLAKSLGIDLDKYINKNTQIQ